MSKLIVKELINDLSLSNYNLDSFPLLKILKNHYFKTKPAVCIERAYYLTDYMKKSQKKKLHPEIRRAKAVSNYLSNREAMLLDNNLLAGSSTSKILGAPVYPELLTGLSIWPELDNISNRKSNPLILNKEDADTLNFEIYPYWVDRTVFEAARKDHPELEDVYDLMNKIVFFIPSKAAVISHTTPKYDHILKYGLKHFIKEASEKQKHYASLKKTKDNSDKVAFYEAMQISMQGIINYAENLSKTALKLSEITSNSDKKKNYKDMAELLKNVPANPAKSFKEALNSLWICHIGVLAENVNQALNPGRLDQILYPYFKKDIENDKITLEETINLLGCFWFKIGDNTNLVPETSERLFGGAGSVPAITLGGVDSEGNDAVNDLTYILLKVTELLKLKDPNVNARYNSYKNTDEYKNRVAEVIINTKAVPAIYNDISCIKTLVNQGESIEDARDYSIIGCVELSSSGREYTASSSLFINLSAPLIMTLNNGKRPLVTGKKQIGPKTGNPENFKTFDEFFSAFELQYKTITEKAINLNNLLGLYHQKLVPSPLLSCFIEGPMANGLDVIYGGSKYKSSGVTHIAFADVCDSLNAIEYAVFVDKKFEMEDVIEALNNNFKKPFDRIRDYIKNNVPKYGTDHPIALKNSKRLVKMLYDFYQAHINYRGGKYRPAFWTMTNHAGIGRVTKEALPSGRKSGDIFSSGITPASQSADELTAAFKSVAELGANNIPGGYALNMKYTPSLSASINNDYLDEFTSFVDAYFKLGGMQVQFNVQTYETLIDAKKNPEKYPELLVRVSGYSAFFKDLNDAMKDELITRTQYNLNSGNAVPLPDFESIGVK